MNCQIILDSWHGRGWADSYLLKLDGRVVGYGLVGGVRAERKEIVTEFYVLPIHRGSALPLFRRFVEVSGARSVEVQTNDILLTLLLYDCAEKIESDVILFHDAFTTKLFRPRRHLPEGSGSGPGTDRQPESGCRCRMAARSRWRRRRDRGSAFPLQCPVW